MKNKKALGFPLVATAGTAMSAIAMKDTLGDFFKNNWKWIAGISAAGIVGWLVYDKWFSDDAPPVKENSNLPPSTMSALEAAAAAQSLYGAMKDPGTEEDVIFQTLESLTYNDFVKVSDAFGKKYYNETLGVEGGSLFDDEFSLFEWLHFELEPEEFAQIKLVVTGKP